MSIRPIKVRQTLLLTLTLATIVGGFPIEAFAQRYVPRDRGLPGRREGGGTRGECIRAAQSPAAPAGQSSAGQSSAGQSSAGQSGTATRPATLTALIPDKNLGLTTSATPTLFWYVPENSASAAEFILTDANDAEIYKARFRVTGEAGIISLSLPESAGLPPLEVGKDYHWSFALICGSTQNSDNSGIVFTDGWIQRIEADDQLAARLANTVEADRAGVYAEAGIWQDAIATLAEQRRTQPNNSALTTQWNTLLESVGLTNLSSQPLMRRYQLAATAPTQPAQSAPLPTQSPTQATP
jgi:hypothetical protein